MLINPLVGDKNRDQYKAALLKALGVQNDWAKPQWPLPHAKEITVQDFWAHHTCYSPSLWVWCDYLKIEGQMFDLTILFDGRGRQQDGGFAVLSPRGDYKSERPVRYYRWSACDHMWRSKNIGNCLNRYTCETCGIAYDVDSSG